MINEAEIAELKTWSWAHNLVGNRQARLTLELINFRDQLVAALKRWMEDRQCAQKCDGPHEDCPCVYCRTGMLLAKANGEDSR